MEFGVREDHHTCIVCLACRYVCQGLLYAWGLYTLGLCTYLFDVMVTFMIDVSWLVYLYANVSYSQEW